MSIDVGGGKSISVALATYNGAQFIRRQLESIAEQDRLPAELVVTDDASTDSTLSIIRDFAASAPFPVRIHCNNDRLGYRHNFMRALSLCRGDLVALCDQDDVWHATKLSVAARALEDPDAVLFFHEAWLIDTDGHQIGPAGIFPAKPLTLPLSAHSLFTPFGFCMVIKRSLLMFSDLWDRSIDTNDPTMPMAHDQWLFFLASIFGVISFSPEKLTDYRQHSGNTYGAPDQSLGARLRRRLRSLKNNRQTYRNQAAAARARSAILACGKTRLQDTWRERAEAGTAACAKLAMRLSMREALYGKMGLVDRARTVRDLQRSGAYTTDCGFGFGSDAMLKDIVLGIVLQRCLVEPDGE